MGDNAFMRMAAEDRAARYEAALNHIVKLMPEEATVPLDRIFGLVREIGKIARNALDRR